MERGLIQKFKDAAAGAKKEIFSNKAEIATATVAAGLLGVPLPGGAVVFAVGGLIGIGTLKAIDGARKGYNNGPSGPNPYL